MTADHAEVAIKPPLLFLGALALGALLSLVIPLGPRLASPNGLALTVGLTFVAIGFALAALSVRNFRLAGTSVVPGEPSTALVVTGPYHVTRNPIYIGLVLIYFGLAIILIAIGITANLEVLEWGTYLAKWTKGDFGLSARGITPVLYDPSPFLNIFFTCKFVVPNGSNAQSSCTREYDDVAESTYKILDPQERVKKSHQAQEMMQREVSWDFVDHELDMYFLSKKVDGMVVRGNYLIDFDRISLQQ